MNGSWWTGGLFCSNSDHTTTVDKTGISGTTEDIETIADAISTTVRIDSFLSTSTGKRTFYVFVGGLVGEDQVGVEAGQSQY